MKRWLRPRRVRVRLALWYVGVMVVVLAVYAGAVFELVRDNVSSGLDERLRDDFDWASDMLAQRPDGTIAPYDETGEGDSPWLQVWSLDGDLLYDTPSARRNPVPHSGRMAAKADEQIVTVPELTPPYRVLSGPSRIGGRPVVVQVARSESPFLQDMHQLLLVLLLGLPFGVAAAGLGGYSLARRALSPVERMRRFTADASHELRTPLTAIRSVGEVGLRGSRDEETYREIIGSMLEEADRLARLVDRLLTLSKADTGEASLSVDVIDLCELADRVAGQLDVLAEEKEQSIQIVRDGAPRCKGDPLVLRQALLNLVDNAIKYSPVGGRITIRIAQPPAGATIDVCDTGPGIPVELQSRIFDRFYRVDKSRSRENGGTGLGLSIAKWAVEVNGGRLTLEETNGAGSTFRITLPQNSAAPITPSLRTV